MTTATTLLWKPWTTLNSSDCCGEVILDCTNCWWQVTVSSMELNGIRVRKWQSRASLPYHQHDALPLSSNINLSQFLLKQISCKNKFPLTIVTFPSTHTSFHQRGGSSVQPRTPKGDLQDASPTARQPNQQVIKAALLTLLSTPWQWPHRRYWAVLHIYSPVWNE